MKAKLMFTLPQLWFPVLSVAGVNAVFSGQQFKKFLKGNDRHIGTSNSIS